MKIHTNRFDTQRNRRLLSGCGCLTTLLLVILLLGLLARFLLLGGAAVIQGMIVLDEPYELVGEEAKEAINSFRSLSLPPEADDIYYQREGAMESVYWIRFQLPPDNLPDFLDLLTFDIEMEEGYCPRIDLSNLYYTTPEWWILDNIETCSGGQYNTGRATAYHVLVDQTNTESWIVYVQIIHY